MSKKVYIYLPIYINENIDQITQGISSLSGVENYVLIDQMKQLKATEPDSLILTDSLHRLSDDANKISRLIVELIEGTDRELFIPGQLDLRIFPQELFPRRDTALKILKLML